MKQVPDAARSSLHEESPSLSRQLTRYVLGTGSALAALGAASPSAEAAIAFYDPSDLVIDLTTTDAIYFDLDNNAPGILSSTSSFAGADFRLDTFGPGGFAEKPLVAPLSPNNGVTGLNLGQPAALRVTVGQSIEAAIPWIDGVANYLEYSGFTTFWDGGGTDYLGLRLGDGGGNSNFGWARITYDDTNNTLTLHDFAVEGTLNTAIAAGATPEPSSALLFALGATGLIARRRRKQS